MCGEHSPVPIPAICSGGSSPHVRGTPHRSSQSAPRGRFIPACAGNTRLTRRGQPPPSVHPRMCGEHDIFSRTAWINGGSSPHVRGTPPGPQHHDPQPRFIPACAGNTILRIRPLYNPSVHPRMCGEHDLPGNGNRIHHGSSPHVRGTLNQAARGGGSTRFIPACAGNTSKHS